MRSNRALNVLALLVVSNSAYGQHRGAPARGGPAQGGQQGHPATHPQHMMTPEMQQHFMMQQWLYEMEMMNQMYEAQRQARLASRNAHGRTAPTHTGTGRPRRAPENSPSRETQPCPK